MCTATELNTVTRDLMELRRMRDELEAEIAAVEDKLKAHMKETDTYELESIYCKVTWKEITSTRVDTKALQSAVPELVARFTKTNTTRRFVVIG